MFSCGYVYTSMNNLISICNVLPAGFKLVLHKWDEKRWRRKSGWWGRGLLSGWQIFAHLVIILMTQFNNSPHDKQFFIDNIDPFFNPKK